MVRWMALSSVLTSDVITREVSWCKCKVIASLKASETSQQDSLATVVPALWVYGDGIGMWRQIASLHYFDKMAVHCAMMELPDAHCS